jgi:hypothetical protein
MADNGRGEHDQSMDRRRGQGAPLHRSRDNRASEFRTREGNSADHSIDPLRLDRPAHAVAVGTIPSVWRSLSLGVRRPPMVRPARNLGPRPPVMPSGHPACGDSRLQTRLRRLFPVRDVRGMPRSRRSSAPEQATKHAYMQGFYGSDGTRTRDLRRDRPVMAVPGLAGMSGDLRLEQALSTAAVRGLPAVGGSFRGRPAGSVRDAIVV